VIVNTMCILAEGRELERTHGSYRLLVLTMWSALLTSFVYCVLAYLLVYYYEDPDDYDDDDEYGGHYYWLIGEIQGFSGILFHWTVWDSSETRNRDFGLDLLDDIPPSIYPWVAFIMLYMYDPDNDLGHLIHLSGIIVGYLHVGGYLNWIFPSCLIIPKNPHHHHPQRNETTSSESTRSVLDQSRSGRNLTNDDKQDNTQGPPEKRTTTTASSCCDPKLRNNLPPPLGKYWDGITSTRSPARERTDDEKGSPQDRARAARLKKFQ